MTFARLFLSLALAIGLSACGSIEQATRNAPFETLPTAIEKPDYRIESFTVTVPRGLKVNENNTYYPFGDIVWRGDPIGDRYQQVKAIFETSLRNSAARIQGTRPVRVDVLVQRFHAITEKARYTVGGVHDITFKIRLVDPVTGVEVVPAHVVRADLAALGGQAAIAADARGETQKLRILAHLEQVLVEELTLPQGHVNARLGLLQAINQI